MSTRYLNKTTLSVILPCRNEEDSLKDCILAIKDTFHKNEIRGEIIVSDSSTDNSPQIARSLNAILVKHDQKGYGIACLNGATKASGRYIFIADPDSSYDFREIPRFLKYLEKGNDFVIGNRLLGKIEKGATPWTHRYIGNPILNYALKFLFNINIGDVNCGMRAIKREAFDALSFKEQGWEFAQEMVIKAKINNINTLELPINYHRRKGTSKLKSLPDGISQFLFAFKSAYTYYKNQALS